jgi:hypothetical protein
LRKILSLNKFKQLDFFEKNTAVVRLVELYSGGSIGVKQGKKVKKRVYLATVVLII